MATHKRNEELKQREEKTLKNNERQTTLNLKHDENTRL
jgi:hypothetical protein